MFENVLPGADSMVLPPICSQLVHILGSKHPDLLDFDVVLDDERSPKVDPTFGIEFLSVVDELNP